MIRQRTVLSIVFTLSVLMMITGCGSGSHSSTGPQEDKLQIVASFSVIADMVTNIGGEKVIVDYLVPIGEHPEDFELISSDLKKISNAHGVILNGFGLERMVERSLGNVTSAEVFYAAKGVTPIPLVGENTADPHAWMDVGLVMDHYVPNILQSLIHLDPEGSEYYQANAELYTKQLQELDNWIREEVAAVGAKNRMIIISENALKYYGAAYGFQAEGIWELNAHEEGTPQQVSRIVDLIKARELPAVFVESTLDKRYMRTVSNETGVPIAGELHTDGLGLPGSGADTYIGMMKHNTKTIVQGLGS